MKKCFMFLFLVAGVVCLSGLAMAGGGGWWGHCDAAVADPKAMGPTSNTWAPGAVPPQPGDGTVKILTDQSATVPERFYRVRQQ